MTPSKPILFTGEMVRATLRDVDPKLQTRRVVKILKANGGGIPGPWFTQAAIGMHRADADLPLRYGVHFSAPNGAECIVNSPYGKPGDRLYVRETWADDTKGGTLYAADPFFDGAEISWNWKPSIHMHRHRSRILLDITGLRVERVQAISEQDAKAEGVEHCDVKGHDDCYYGTIGYRCAYEALWNELNARRGYGWDVNPWVWVLSFKRIVPQSLSPTAERE